MRQATSVTPAASALSSTAAALSYDALGGSAIYSQCSTLDRNLRDIATAWQHILAQRLAQQAAAELMLGTLDKPFPFL
jgi:hypothetical protein